MKISAISVQYTVCMHCFVCRLRLLLLFLSNAVNAAMADTATTHRKLNIHSPTNRVNAQICLCFHLYSGKIGDLPLLHICSVFFLCAMWMLFHYLATL